MVTQLGAAQGFVHAEALPVGGAGVAGGLDLEGRDGVVDLGARFARLVLPPAARHRGVVEGTEDRLGGAGPLDGCAVVLGVARHGVVRAGDGEGGSVVGPCSGLLGAGPSTRVRPVTTASYPPRLLGRSSSQSRPAMKSRPPEVTASRLLIRAAADEVRPGRLSAWTVVIHAGRRRSR